MEPEISWMRTSAGLTASGDSDWEIRTKDIAVVDADAWWSQSRNVR
jgi:hypothetical protein